MSSEEIIRLEDASVRFNLAMQKNRGLKEYFATLRRRELLFQEFFALRHIDLSVKAGESWGFVGRNGSGKSTLLKLITGILKPYEGTVSVRKRVAPLLELGAGFDIELTGRENVMLNGLLLGMSKSDILSHYDEIVDFAELGQFMDVPVKNYSSGMKSRLGFAVATCMQPEILIADEVLSTGDQTFRKKCEERMANLLKNNTTLLFVSHAPASVRRLCTKVMWLDGGQIRMCGSTKEVMDVYENTELKPK